MIDLFVPPVVRPQSASLVHRIEPTIDEDPYSPIVPRKRRGQSKRAAYYRKYHAEKREQRLKRMKEYYRTHKAEHVARARKWRELNPKQYKAIQKENQRRRNLLKATA